MERANVVDIRKAMEAATAMAKAGVLFVPTPVLNSKDHELLIVNMKMRVDTIATEVINSEED